jgi:hypothetical protein
MPLSSTFRDPWSDYECRASPPDVIACADPYVLGWSYVYLLGIYLGDGTIAEAPRNVWRLRIFQDLRYGQIISEISAAIQALTLRTQRACQEAGLYRDLQQLEALDLSLPSARPRTQT